MSRKGCCLDCELPADKFGLDLWLPLDVWRAINPTPDGLLCPTCSCRRLAAAFPDAQGVLGQLAASLEEFREHANAVRDAAERHG